MDHEIKNPLTPIQLSAERIAKRFAQSIQLPVVGSRFNTESNLQVTSSDPSPDGVQLTKVIDESTATILREVNSLKSMVDEFSRFARLPNAKPEPGDLNEIIMQVYALYEDRIDAVKIEMRLADGLPATEIDAEQIKRVFVNLVDNAIETFGDSTEDAKIVIRTRHEPTRGIVVAEVGDNGKGIDPAYFQKMFQHYFSTKGRGTGLGLAIVHRIISEHNGRIRVVANQPRGARFILELPTTF